VSGGGYQGVAAEASAFLTTEDSGGKLRKFARVAANARSSLSFPV
jgi:hypothetical protein